MGRSPTSNLFVKPPDSNRAEKDWWKGEKRQGDKCVDFPENGTQKHDFNVAG
jgi:hypothetical protein